MRLFSVQPKEVYDEIIKKGSYICDPSKCLNLRDWGFQKPYEWMIEIMNSYLKNEDHIHLPVWAWYKIDGKNELPNFNFSIISSSDGYLLELEIPNEDVLLSDFDIWHFPLNDCIYESDDEFSEDDDDQSSEEDDDQFNEEDDGQFNKEDDDQSNEDVDDQFNEDDNDQSNEDDDDQSSEEDDEGMDYDKLIDALDSLSFTDKEFSWVSIFNVNKSEMVQATFWQIKKENIVHVHEILESVELDTVISKADWDENHKIRFGFTKEKLPILLNNYYTNAYHQYEYLNKNQDNLKEKKPFKLSEEEQEKIKTIIKLYDLDSSLLNFI